MVALALMTGPASAADPLPTPLWREVSAGADATPHIWLVYSATTISPFTDLWSDGWRIRLAGGYGQYHYDAARYDPTVKKSRERLISFTGHTNFTDALIGYLWRLGPLTAKAFAGASMIGNDEAPDDVLASSGRKIGPKGALELWLNIGDFAWASLDASYTSAHHTYAAHTRLGFRVLPTVSLGMEAALNGSAGRDYSDDVAKTVVDSPLFDPLHRDARLGGFVRYEWFGGEISLSGGISTDLADKYEAYANTTFIYQF